MILVIKQKRCCFVVLRFCTDDEVSSENVVIMDGYYANTLNNERYCTCTARALYSTVSKLQYDGLLYPFSFENNTALGVKCCLNN